MIMNTVENLRLRSPSLYGNEKGPSQALWDYEREQLDRRQKWQGDLDDVLAYARVQIFDAIRTGNAELVGKVVLAARNANLNRRADRVCCIDPDKDPVNRPTEDIAALRVLLAASVGRGQ